MDLKELISVVLSEGKLSAEAVLDKVMPMIETDRECLFRQFYIGVYGYKLNEKIAKEIVSKMLPFGEKWTMAQTYEVGSKINIDFNTVSKCEWYAVMNMKYNDYYDFAKKHDKEEDAEFYADMAKCFVKDIDAKEHKIFDYFM